LKIGKKVAVETPRSAIKRKNRLRKVEPQAQELRRSKRA